MTREPDAGGGGSSGSDGAGPRRPDGAVEVRLRRAPRYRAFIVTGVLLGVLAGVVLGLGVGDPGDAESFSRATLVRYFAAILALIGAVLGAGMALLSERRRR